MNKKNILFCSFFIFSIICFAQNNDISLPDVTTVIDSEKQVLIIPSPNITELKNFPKKSSSIVPIFTEEVPIENTKEEELFSLQGDFSFGLPEHFYSKIEINHKTQKDELNFTLDYKNLNCFNLFTEFDYKRIFSSKRNIKFSINQEYFSRDFIDFSILQNNENFLLNKSSLLFISPSLEYTRNITNNFLVQTQFLLDFSKEMNVSKDFCSRTQFFIKSEYNFNALYLSKIKTNLSCVINSKGFFRLPFELFLSSDFTTKNNKQVLIELRGGMESNVPKVSENELKYKDSRATQIPSEESCFFVNLNSSLVLNNFIKLNFNSDYKDYCFENGKWIVDYNSKIPNTNYFEYKHSSFKQFSTDFSLDFLYNVFILSTAIKINYIDLLPLEDRYNYNLKLTYKSSKSLLASIQFGGALDSVDKCPKIDLEGGIQFASKNILVLLKTEDFIKLISNSFRTYQNNIQERGKVFLSIKFKY